MNITLRQVRAFLAVAEPGRFNLAAGALGLTQAVVSLLIKELEWELGVRLFDRHTRKVNLADIALGTLLDDDPEIRSQPVSQDRLTLICRADHRLAARRAIG